MKSLSSLFLRTLVATALLITASVVFAAEPPKWVMEAAAGLTPDGAASVGAPAKIVLLESTYIVSETGGLATNLRSVIAIRNKSGTGRAAARVSYLQGGDVVKRADAWLVRNGKIVRSYSMRDWLDINPGSEGALVSDAREKVISLESLAAPGDIFAYETRVEGKLLVASLTTGIAAGDPMQLARIQLQLPPGFALDQLIEGPSTLEPSVSPDRRTYTWTQRDRPYLKEEAWTDPAAFEDSVLRLRFRPPPGATKFTPPVFLDWGSVTRWEMALCAGQCDTSASLKETAARTVAGLTDWGSRVRALCEYAQGVRYIALDRGLARGLGLQPRRATVVHATGYGDCKDKSNLLRALLREIGVTAYPVGVLATFDRPPVNPAWPALDQFNHAIVAIEAPADYSSPAITTLADGRRLLIFDPTDEDTPLGGLPWPLQGALGQLVAEGVSELVRLPALAEVEQFAGRNSAKLKLRKDGSVEGSASGEFRGQYASMMRSLFRPLSEKETKERILRIWSETLRGAQLAKVERQDAQRDGRYTLSAEFTAPGFAQPLRETLALVRLDLFNRDSVPRFTEKQRRTPIKIRPTTEADEITLELPEGVSVDELPPAAKLESRFGNFERTLVAEGQTITLRRKFQLRDCQVPLAEYAALRQFLADCAKADRAAVILRR